MPFRFKEQFIRFLTLNGEPDLLTEPEEPVKEPPLPKPQEFKPPTLADKMAAIALRVDKEKTEQRIADRNEKLPKYIDSIFSRIEEVANNGGFILTFQCVDEPFYLSEDEIDLHIRSRGFSVKRDVSFTRLTHTIEITWFPEDEE